MEKKGWIEESKMKQFLKNLDKRKAPRSFLRRLILEQRSHQLIALQMLW